MRQILYLLLFFLLFSGCSISEEGVVEVVPLAPSELKAIVALNGQVDLTWKDIATNETGYKIERKTDSGIFSDIGAVSADITTFTDKTTTQATNYTYRVYSFNKAGKSIQYSNEVSIKTFDYFEVGTAVVVWTNAIATNALGAPSNQMANPSDIFVDTKTNIYVSDAGNNRILKWGPGSSGGITVAGTNRTDGTSGLLAPQGIWLDPSGSIYTSDAGNHRIQKKEIEGTCCTAGSVPITVAGGNGKGTKSNQFVNPFDVFVNANGLIYVADRGNHRIQRWTAGATSGVTVAGGNGEGFSLNSTPFPSYIFVDAANNVYVTDNKNHKITRWAPGAPTGTVVAGQNRVKGAAANQLNSPAGIFVDSTGSLYVSDTGNNRIQKWAVGATSGVTVAGGNGEGTALNQLKSPTSIFVDSKGNIYVLELGNNRVSKWPQ